MLLDLPAALCIGYFSKYYIDLNSLLCTRFHVKHAAERVNRAYTIFQKTRALPFGCGGPRSGFPVGAGAQTSQSPGALTETFTDRRAVVPSRHRHVAMRIFGDGCVEGEAPAGLLGLDTGSTDCDRWWISPARLCVRWRERHDGRPHCFAVGPIGGGQLRWRPSDGEEGTAWLEDVGRGGQ